MSVVEVSNLPPRERCRSCGLRFEGDERTPNLPGPWVSFGADQEPETEEDDRGKLWQHRRLLVCGGCLRKATATIPDQDDRNAELEADLALAVAAKTDAIETARKLSEIVHQHLNGLDETDETVDLAGMDKEELRAFAKAAKIPVGPGNHSEDKLRTIIREALGTDVTA